MALDVKQYLRPEILAQIGSLELRARFVVEGFMGGMHESPYHGQSVEFAQHREYVPGDDIRHLDWRVYGKSDRFYVKQFEAETNLRAYVLLDCSGSMRYPEHDTDSGRMTKYQYAATIAASLGYLLIHQRDAVGLILFDDGIRAEVPALSSHSHLRSLIRQLELGMESTGSDGATGPISPWQKGKQREYRRDADAPRENHRRDAGATVLPRAAMRDDSSVRSWDGVFAEIAGKLGRRGLVIVVSDMLGDPDEVVVGLGRLRYAHHDVVVMHVLDHDEREFPFQENTLFEGLESPELRLQADPQSLRTSYLAAVRAFVGGLRGACMNDRIDYVGLSTMDPLDMALRGYLAARLRAVKARR